MDEDGRVVVLGRRVFPAAEGSMPETTFDRCPTALAAAPLVGRTMRRFRRRREGYADPEVMTVVERDALDIVAGEHAALVAFQQARAIREMDDA